MTYLRSLGQWPGRSGFACDDVMASEASAYLEVKQSGFGELNAVRHSASIEGMEVGWDVMPKVLGTNVPKWL